MRRNDIMARENEWLIMETLWESDMPLTSQEVFEQLMLESDLSLRIIRVLIKHLCDKKFLGYTVDENDARIYHYYALKTKEECQRKYSEWFISNFFGGDRIDAVSVMLQGVTLTDEQITALGEILDKAGKGQ